MRSNDQSLSLDLTPLIDVVFLLLIFFMLSTSFDKVQWLDLQLPHIEEQEQTTDINKPFVIGIDAQGALHMNEKNIGIKDNAQLKKYLQQYITQDSVVVIHGDAKAPHASLMQLLEVLGKLKVTQLHLAADV